MERGRKLQLLERLDLGGDRAESRREALALVVGVDAEAGKPADAVGEVELSAQLEVLLLLGGGDPVDELTHEVGVELGEIGEKLDVTVQANGRQRTGRQVQVGCTDGDRLLEQGVDRQQGGA